MARHIETNVTVFFPRWLMSHVDDRQWKPLVRGRQQNTSATSSRGLAVDGRFVRLECDYLSVDSAYIFFGRGK